MSKLFVTNNKILFEKTKSVIEDSVFKVSFEYNSNNLFVLSTQKLQVEGMNYYQSRNGFIVQTGTMVCKLCDFSNRLEYIYDRFDGNVKNIRNLMYGNYAVIIYKDNMLYCFTETTACYDLFYTHDDSSWFISNSLYDITKIFGSRLSINRLNVLEEVARFMILNNETYFDDVYRLDGFEYLKIDSVALNLVTLNYEVKHYSLSDLDNNIETLVKELKCVSKTMTANLGNPTLGATGGLDSRISLASYLSVGARPLLTYGFGNSFLAPSKEGDVEVDKMFTKKFNLDFDLKSWNETVPLDKNWIEYTQKYGYVVYSGCEDAYKFYTNKKQSFVIFGYMGEFFREFDWLKNIEGDYVALSQYINKFHIEPNAGIFANFPELYNHVYKKWEKLCMKRGLNPNKIQKEDLFWINLEYRHRADSVMLNFLNLFKYSHYLLSEYTVLSNSYVPIAKKFNAEYMLRILNELCPEILDIPIFSHCQFQLFDSANLCLKTMPIPLVKRLKELVPMPIKNALKKHGIYRNKAQDIYGPVYDLLSKDDNEDKIKRLFKIGDLSFIKTNPDPMFVVSAIYIVKTLENSGLKI